MSAVTDDLNIASIEALMTPEQLKTEMALTGDSLEKVRDARETIYAILERKDPRLFLVALHIVQELIGKGCLNCTCFILRCGLWVLLGVSSVTRSAFKPQLVCLISILFEVCSILQTQPEGVKGHK